MLFYPKTLSPGFLGPIRSSNLVYLDLRREKLGISSPIGLTPLDYFVLGTCYSGLRGPKS